jgi:hypothetical protein
MFKGITGERVAAMTPLEHRWLDNIRKAFADSDAEIGTERMPDDCIETLFKGIDAAKNLRLSLMSGGGDLRSRNRARFMEFLECEIPSPTRGARRRELTDARTGETREWSVAEIMYEIRCMIHENENLDEREPVDYHIRLRWTEPSEKFVCEHKDGRVVINARLLWRRLREILAKFITGIDAHEAMARKGAFSITISPEIGRIQPKHRRKRAEAQPSS